MRAGLRSPIEAPGLKVQFLIEGSETNGAIAMFRSDFQAGAQSPMAHSHDAFDETVYGLEGELTMVVGGVEHRLGPGEAVYVPRGVVHGFRVKERAAVLSISTPGLFRGLLAVWG
jgi:quercetin dioxygenase-like cupin family protein